MYVPAPPRIWFCKLLSWASALGSGSTRGVSRDTLFGRISNTVWPVTTKKVPGFNVVPAPLEQRELLIRWLQRVYFRGDPMLRTLGIEGCATPAFKDYVVSCLDEGLSFMAVGRSPEDIQGVCLNATVHHNEPPPSDELLESVGRVGRAVVEFDDFCFRASDLFRRYFVSHVFDLRYLAVTPRMRRSGLAKALAERSLLLARELRYPMACMHCTSQYSANLAHSLGMAEAWSLPYSQYLNDRQKPAFRPAAPHTHVRIMVMNL